MPNPEPPICFLLGLPFHQTTMAETLEDCDAAMGGGNPSYLVTANADFVAQAYTDPDLRRILFFARRVVCDGMPLVWLSRFFRIPLPERVTGSDMVFHLFSHCDRDHRRVFFLGSDNATLENVAVILKKRYPGMEIAGWIAPPIAPVHEWPNETILERLKAVRPHLLLVAVGCPKQERWIFQHYREAGVPLSIGIGASLDFISGKQVRSPKWMQRSGLEWVWRLFSDPKRLAGRYWKDFKYLVVLTFKQAQIVFRKPRRPADHAQSGPIKAESAVASGGKPAFIRLQLPSSIQRDNLSRIQLPENPAEPVLCDASDVEFLDSSGIGLLVRLVRTCQESGVPCAFVASGESQLTRLVENLRMESVLPVYPDTATALNWLAERWRRQADAGPIPANGIMQLSGELDAQTIGPVEVEISRLLETLPLGEDLVLSCRDLVFLDSYAVGRLIALKKKAQSRGGDLYLVDPSPNVLKLLQLFKLQQFFIKA